MEAGELRIGNIVRFYGNNEPIVIEEINSIAHNGWVNGYIMSNVSDKTAIQSLLPVTLTEEWFLKLGAVPETLDWYFFDGFAVCLYPETKTIKVAIHKTMDTYVFYCVHVHHFQNLVYAITNKSLTLNKPTNG